MKLDSTEIKKYITSNNSNFKRFKMHYTSKEILAIDSFNLNKVAFFSYYGSYDNLKNINKFLSTLGDNDMVLVNKMEKIIYNITKKVLKGYNMTHFWMDIRVTMPNNDYDIPRWHKDGPFFPNDKNEKDTSKFVTIMKGRGTLLIKSTKRVNEIYNKIQEQLMDERRRDMKMTMEEQIKLYDKYRPIFAKELSKEPVVQPKNNQGLIFFTGVPLRDNAAVHSEPKMDTPRIFISILPSSKEHIEALKERWSK